MIDKIGGNATLTELYAFVPTSAHYPYYKGIVHDMYTRRRLSLVAAEINRLSNEPRDDASELLDEVESLVLSIKPQDLTRSDDGGVYAMQAFDSLEARIEGKTSLGLATGFSWLDKLTGGMRQELWYAAARPSVGKTAFLVQVLAKCIRENIPVGAFSLEMPGEMFMNRLIAALAEVPFTSIMSAKLHRDEMRRITRAVSQIQKTRFRLDDRTKLTHSEVRAQARRWKRNYGIQMVGLDYLQRMAPPRHGGDRGRSEEHAENSTALADATKELGIPFLVLAQLNRESEKQKRAPRLSDIEWCGRAEQDADVALLLSTVIRKKGEKDDPEDAPKQVLWELAKQRNGPTGDAIHLFDRESAGFRAHPMTSRLDLL